jgi:hypothetical protein
MGKGRLVALVFYMKSEVWQKVAFLGQINLRGSWQKFGNDIRMYKTYWMNKIPLLL